MLSNLQTTGNKTLAGSVAGREGVVLLQVEGGEGVVHVPVVGLIGSDQRYHFPPLGVVRLRVKRRSNNSAERQSSD